MNSDTQPSRLEQIREVLFVSKGSLTRRVAQSGIWVVTLRTITRALEFARMVILARLLAPDDFGLFGMALLALSFLNTFSETGFTAALIRKRDRSEDYLDAAWTVQVLRGVVLAVLMFVGAPAVAAFFQEPETTMIIRALSAVAFLKGFGNVGIIYFRKDLEFQKQFAYEFSGTLTTFVVSILIAAVSRTVWALVLGYVAGEFVKAVLSYVLHPYRPHFDFDISKMRELFSFGGWIWGTTAVVYVAIHGDDFFLGRLLGAAALGYYQMAYRIASVSSTEITNLVSQVAFPAYSKIQQNLAAVGRAFVRTFGLVVYLTIPVGVGIYLLVPEFTLLFLGLKWAPIIWPARILAVAGIIRSISAIWGPLYLATGMPQHSFAKQTLRVLFTFAPIYWLTIEYGMPGTSSAVLLGICAALGYDCYYTLFRSDIRIRSTELAKSLLIPGIGSAIVALFLLLAKTFLSINVFQFLVLIVMSMGLYLTTTWLVQSWLRPSPLQDLVGLARGLTAK